MIPSIAPPGARLAALGCAVLSQRACHPLARLAGVAPVPIWQRGFIERTSSGLLLLKLGLDQLAHEFLTVADAWGGADPP
jgi:hypothetical protein